MGVIMLINKIITAFGVGRSHLAGGLRLSSLASLLIWAIAPGAQAIPAQYPLFLSNPVVPVMMLTMDKDHQLYLKAYDDYSDFIDMRATLPDGSANPSYMQAGADGVADVSYIHGYKYYGYFDNRKCYNYSVANGRFEPASATADGYCTGQWSGNFLNWGTMSRMDIVRKILYGGLRFTDTSAETVIERAFLPNDAHSFAKHYDGLDINRLTPFTTGDGPGQVPVKKDGTAATGITLCNTTSSSGYSNEGAALTAAPLVRVAKGNYSLWASSERWQCRWGSGSTPKGAVPEDKLWGANGNEFAKTGIRAYRYAPENSGPDKLSVNGLPIANAGEYKVRILVCASSALQEDNCRQYTNASYPNKPAGVLQKYGETNELNFGLITGSYGRNKSGGVLRKNAGNMLDEINLDWGTFKKPAPAGGGIINTLNVLRLFGYGYDVGDHGSYVTKDNCDYTLLNINDSDNGSNCSNWGNPQSEIYYEALRYLGGLTPTAKYNRLQHQDINYLAGLTQASWVAPVTNANANYCARLSVLQFSGASSSYDVGDEAHYLNISELVSGGIDEVDKQTDLVGDLEKITGTSRFVGKIIGGVKDYNTYELCTAKTVNKLSQASGICPESPRLDGGYTMVGMAKYARQKGIPLKGVTPAKTSTVRTFGVAMAPAVPKVELAVPLSSTKKVIIQPACQNLKHGKDLPTNCAIVDFKVVKQEPYQQYTKNNSDPYDFPTGMAATGTLYVNWEDGEQGGDYDQDMWGTIKYYITPTTILIQTRVIAQSSTSPMGFGYVLNGTTLDGFRVHSGTKAYDNGTSCNAAQNRPCTCLIDPNQLTGICNSPGSVPRMASYTIGSSNADFLKAPLEYAAKWGGYDTEFATKNAANLDSAISARKPTDSFFYATNPEQLASNLDTAFLTISNDKGAASGVASNNSFLTEGTFLFRSEFNSFDWTGVLRAYAYDSSGNLAPKPAHSTSDSGKMPISGSGRNVYTYDGSATPAATTPFIWDKLTPAQKAALKISPEGDLINAEKRADWLRGNSTHEVPAATGFRSRTPASGVRNILGDLVNSSPVYVGAADFDYHSLAEGGSSYAAYVALKADKTPRIYVGGNDGMLHAFDASTNPTTILKELYAYIPSIAFPKLANLTRVDYGRSANPHKFIVDGPIATSDVYLNGKWSTIIVGTLGAGGRGLYALEVMNSRDGNSAVDDVKVLFELNETNYPQLGYVLGTPTIAPMANGRWAVIFGNGDSSGKTSQLFVVDLAEPLAKTKVLDTGAGTGLSTPALLRNSRGIVESAYAGDLNGNLWKFDLSNSDPTLWKMDYLLFKAMDKNTLGTAQPIFAAPTLGVNAMKNNLNMVYFGTGKYYDAGDNIATAVPRHSYYAIADVGETLSPVSRVSLKEKTMSTNYGATTAARVVNEVNPDWKTENGWFLNLGGTAGSDIGERVTTTAILVRDKLIFPTLISSVSPCEFGGKSWLMEVVAVGDKYVGKKIMDGNELIQGVILGDLVIGKSDPDGRVSGTQSDPSNPPINKKATLPSDPVKRSSWRQLLQ